MISVSHYIYETNSKFLADVRKTNNENMKKNTQIIKSPTKLPPPNKTDNKSVNNSLKSNKTSGLTSVEFSNWGKK